MTDTSVDTRAIEGTAASAPDLIAANGEIPAEKVGDGWRASPNGFAESDHRLKSKANDAGGREFLQKVKDCHRAEKERRERERMESGNPNAYLTADMISEMRNERDEQILSAALGIYERERK